MPVTLKSDLITGRVIKTGVNHEVNSQDLRTFESNIAKALLSEKSASTFITDYTTLTNMTSLTFNPSNHYLGNEFDKTNIDILTSSDLINRNYTIVGNYVSNEDTTVNGEANSTVRINNSTTTTVTSKVLDDSSAYKNASLRVTLRDSYFTDPLFGDVNGLYNCTFDTSNTSKLVNTRNTNANFAHINELGTISASEYTEWNTQNGYGPFFINGSVSIDSITGQPSASLYGALDSLNLLTKDFSIDLKTDVPNIVPSFGRYYVTFSTSSGSSVTINTNGSSNLVVTADNDDWNNFLANLNTIISTYTLPSSIEISNLTEWVLQNNSVSNGFTLELNSQNFTTDLTLINNGINYSSPLDFDLGSMDFSTKSMYILEKSMELYANNGSSNLTNVTINGTNYTNNLTIYNGSLNLEQTTDVISGIIELVDGEESLGVTDYNTNGVIEFYNSARVSSATDDESNFPRATRTAVSGSSGILDYLAVQYQSDSDSAFIVDYLNNNIDTLNSQTVTYDVTTLVGQTTTDDNADNWSNKIGINNMALAIVRDSNTSINKSDISFHSNSNTYANNNDNKLSVIDIECAKAWSESKVYDYANQVIEGLTADIKSFNMESVPFNLKDIRFVYNSKSLNDLTLSSSNNDWSLSCPDSYLTNSVEKLGLIDDSTITDFLLSGSDDTINSLNVVLRPRAIEIHANKFTKFHHEMEISFGSNSQITYDDEFTILNYSKSAISTSPQITNFLNVPSNTKLYKRSYTESFAVKLPFRFAYNTNLFLTSPTISHTVEYYVLTDNNNNNADLPRYYLSGIKTNLNTDLYATISNTEWTTTISFSNKDFKPYTIGIQKKTTGDWESVTLDAPSHADIWYNTRSTVISPVGSFYVALTLSPAMTSIDINTFYTDMELDKGTQSFHITGKIFSASEINNMSSVNFNSLNLSGSSSGTLITGLGNVTYSRDSDVDPNTQASTTLTASGYTFKIIGELYLSLRIFVCPNGIFKSVKTLDGGVTTTSYRNIEIINGEDAIKIDVGVYGYGALRNAIRNTSTASWQLNNDAIRATYHGTTGFSYQRVSTINQEFRPSAGKRGFKITQLRGLTKGLSTTIYRTPSTYEFNLAGNTVDGDLYSGFNSTIFGNINVGVNSNFRSMYTTNYGDQSWEINLTYGYYELSDTVDATSDPNVSTVPSYSSLISSRRGIKILSKSLNTNFFTYVVQYTSANTLSIFKHDDIDALDYSVDSSGYNFITEFTPDELNTAGTNNIIGNILNIHYNLAGVPPNISCQFSICPPYLKFTAINPDDVTSIPFNSSSVIPVTRYMRVNNTNTTTSGTYNPFSGHSSINNISFVQNNVKQYLAYYLNYVQNINYMTIRNYQVKVELGSGLNSQSTVSDWYTFYDDFISNSTFSNDNISITVPDSSRKFKIYINQQKHSAFSNFFIFDQSFAEYNLQVEIGSSFISDNNNGSSSVVLEFVAGDCTKLDMYAIKDFTIVNHNLDVTFVKYSSGEDGIDNNFLNATTVYGFSLPYISAYTKTVSTPLYTSNPGTSPKRTFWDILDALKASITPATFNSWTSISVGSSPAKITFIPANSTGSENIVSAFTLSQNIPRSILALQLEDFTRVEDIFKLAKYRVRYNGDVVTESVTLFPRSI